MGLEDETDQLHKSTDLLGLEDEADQMHKSTPTTAQRRGVIVRAEDMKLAVKFFTGDDRLFAMLRRR